MQYASEEACRQMQRLVKNPNRNSTVRALQTALRKDYDHTIYKVDIKDFFESIPHAELIKLIDEEKQLDPITKTLLKRLLEEFSSIKGSRFQKRQNRTGLPRGVSISQLAADLYMQRFDRQIFIKEGVLFYARYVDDIVIILLERHADSLIKQINDEIKKIGLSVNTDKTVKIKYENKSYHSIGLKANQFQYLGYTFKKRGSQLETGVTVDWVNKYKHRLNCIFESRRAAAPKDTYADGLFINRLRFLFGNRKLNESKNAPMVGFFFSHKALDENAVELRALNSYFENYLKKNILEEPCILTDLAKKRLEEFSIIESFKSRAYYNPPFKKIAELKACWESLDSGTR
ncbi:antiviral reverse transcriptase Drt3a [Dermabacteraceae bacterium P13088]